VRGSNPTSASRLSLSRLEQPGSIPALVLPSGGMAARHRKGATADMTSVFTTDVSLPYKHDCEEKNKSGRGRDVVLAYYNHSKYPSPGATMTLTIDRGKRIFEDENDVRFTERVLSRSDRIVLCWYFALNYANQPVKCTPSSCVPALR
ncbi:hypothetical protein CSKR_100174, partial [Clonorchis sinensis]